jgi:hypothetical protein
MTYEEEFFISANQKARFFINQSQSWRHCFSKSVSTSSLLLLKVMKRAAEEGFPIFLFQFL